MLPTFSELNPDLVMKAVADLLEVKVPAVKLDAASLKRAGELIVPRSSALCAGCPHLGSYAALVQVMKKLKKELVIVNGDIGCYEQGGYGLAADPRTVSVLDVIEAVEGPIDPEKCVLVGGPCGHPPCSLHDAWMVARAALEDALRNAPAMG